MTGSTKNIAIAGAGLVGSLLAIYLAKRGYQVTLFERRPDMRTQDIGAGKSINLALSNRGLRALEEVGLASEIKKAAIPMNGRVMHDVSGKLSFLPYGKEGQFINSISRTALNIILLNAAEQEGVKINFNKKFTHVNLSTTTLTFESSDVNTSTSQHSENFSHLFGADGSWSAVRTALEHSDRFSFSQQFIDHGYKEFHIPAGHHGEFQFDKNALHIWPRQSFMMIGLPNPDGSFTGTFFYPWEGKNSFQSFTTDEQIKSFFESAFPDFVKITPDYLRDFHSNPVGSLATIQCWPWSKNNVMLLGDAAHGIVPFYGQGMNAGFEDCRILNDLLGKHHDDVHAASDEFQKLRKPDTDAIAKLALDNFIEMRDLVADADFLLRKKIESHLHSLYPQRWIPLYSMVTFHDDIRYSDALATGLRQRKIMDEVMTRPDIANTWSGMNFEAVINQLG